MRDTEQQNGSFRIVDIVQPFTNLVSLQARWVGNRLDKRFPLNLVLEVEEHRLSIPSRPGILQRLGRRLSGQEAAESEMLQLRIRVRHCYVRYQSTEIEVLSESKYESARTAGEFQTSRSERTKKEFKAKGALGLNLKTTLKVGQPAGSVSTNAGADVAYQTSTAMDRTTVSKPDIYEVRAVPNGWRIGHTEFGDPNQASSCLDGRYFQRPVSEHANTCEAEFREGHDSGFLHFSVTVRDGLQVERIGGGIASAQEVALAKNGMRDRVAALRLERHLRLLYDTNSRADDELPIATLVCEVVRALEDPSQPKSSDEARETGLQEASRSAARKHRRPKSGVA